MTRHHVTNIKSNLLSAVGIAASNLRMSSSVADDAAVNSYEKQLYTVFKTFDVDNSEALDRAAVHALCDSLQLEDRGSALIDTLFEHRSDRVTFAQFRNGLLAVLGADTDASAEHLAADDPASSERPPSDEESSGCEVAPRFVFGTKKYGRRSRPQRAPDTASAPRSSSASRLDGDEYRACSVQLGRSASTADARVQNNNTSPRRLDPARRIDRAEALALCRSLSMDGVDGLIERIFEDVPTAEPTVGEFFGRLNTALATTIEEARDPVTETVSVAHDGLDDETAAGVPVDLIVETWERSGVPKPRALLLELGFGGPALRPSDLERALDEELRALPTSGRERALLLVAALSASRLRGRLARGRAEAAAAERDKLRADVAEANTRARLLAQEVDENHARIESELKASLRRAEARHAETARAAAAEASAERDRAATLEVRLQAEASRHADLEARLRAEAGELSARVGEAETRVAAAEERLAAAERERARLATEVALARREDAVTAEGVGRAGGELSARIDALRKENEVLRDRNDELVAELEKHARCQGCEPGLERPGGDLSAELAHLLPPCQPEVKLCTLLN